jgi:beta-glucosidase
VDKSRAIEFPQGFLWGAATAAHQVEGGNSNNDWWEWEHRGGKIADGTTSEIACDQFNRYEEDFDLAKRFGHNAHRLSLEWSRIEPEQGIFSSKAIDHYRRVLEALHERGIEPIVTLHHFTTPLWIAKDGGWENASIVEYFIRYAKVVASELGELIKLWNTINEPNVYVYESYIDGTGPPGASSLRSASIVLVNMLRAHALAYHTIHETSRASECQVGIAKHMRIFDPMRQGHPIDRTLAWISDFLFNRWFLEAIETGRLAWPIGIGQQVQILSGTQDFIGLNYYSRDMTKFSLLKPQMLFMEHIVNPGSPVNDLGWEIYPEGIYRLLLRLKEYNKPIYITENGIPALDDAKRVAYLRDHLSQVHRAITEGADVRGYLHWSLLDNFEWAEGLTPRFGLFGMDYETQERTPRPSAEAYAKVATENRLDPAWFSL